MLKLDHLSKSFGTLKVVENLNLELQDGEILALIGPSGSGKTTVLNMVSGIIQPDTGTIQGNNCRIGYMFQQSRLLPWKTMLENIAIVRDDRDEERLKSLIGMVGLSGFENYYPNELSGGMVRRVALARAFYYDGELELFDEPFSGLDYGIRMELIRNLLNLWQARKTPMLFVTHEIDEALMVATKIVLLTKNPMTVKEVISLPGKEGRNPSSADLQMVRSHILDFLFANSGTSLFG